MPSRVRELEAELAALRQVVSDLTVRDRWGELAYRGEADAPVAMPAENRRSVEAALAADAGRRASVLQKRQEEVARAARRALYHFRRDHRRLASDCDYCSFELGQLERALTVLDAERLSD